MGRRVREDFLQRIYFMPRLAGRRSFKALPVIEVVGKWGLSVPQIAERFGLKRVPGERWYKLIADHVQKNKGLYYETHEMSVRDCEEEGIPYYNKRPIWVTLTPLGLELLALLEEHKYEEDDEQL